MGVDVLTTLAIIGGAFAMMAALAIRFRSFRRTVSSMRALRSHEIHDIVLRVDDREFRVSLTEDTGGDDIQEVRRAVEQAKARVLNAA